MIAGDLSWEDAKNACEERGGYLATITSEEEYEKIGEMADRSGLTYLWLGAKLQSDIIAYLPIWYLQMSWYYFSFQDYWDAFLILWDKTMLSMRLKTRQ